MEGLPGGSKCPARMLERVLLDKLFSLFSKRNVCASSLAQRLPLGGFLEMHTIKGTVHQIFKAFL